MSENGTSEATNVAEVAAKKVDEVDLYKCKYLIEKRTSASLRQQLVGEHLQRVTFDLGVVDEDIRRYDKEFTQKYGVSLFKVNFEEDGTITPMPSVAGAPRVGVKS